MLGLVPQAATRGGAGAGRPGSKPTWTRTGTAGFAPLPANQPGHPGAVEWLTLRARLATATEAPVMSGIWGG